MRSSLAPGLPYPLGATVRDGGVNFAVASEHASALELCIFDTAGHERRELLPGHEHGLWFGFLPGADAGLRYGYRAHGPHAPARGHRFDPDALLLDPYAREVVGRFDWAAPESSTLSARVPAPLPGPAPTGVRVPAAKTILYELHVKGFSRLNPAVPGPLRGTFAGLAHPASLEYLRALGVTTLSLMPVQYSLAERHLVARNLTNYWGYNTIAWFCPDPRLSSTPDDPTATRLEFRNMVEAVHAAGLEVVLDVVFNHSAEAGDPGATLSLRGLDNALYYRLDPDDPARLINWTGCGNTLDVRASAAVRLVLDALRYWVADMGVDGFRFDLAPILGRGDRHFDPRAPLLQALEQDPILARAKLIAEPWDLGPDGYQLGHFPRRWHEWNDRFRDGVRRFWLTRDVDRAEFARRLAGSSDRFTRGQRPPTASINFVAAHDGFTLADLVSYSRKHNLDNGEHDRDGHDHNYSINCGIEGPSKDPRIVELRAALRRALLATVFVSQGTPLLLAGDELGRSQAGNNNAYCQDNRISWIDWSAADMELLEFVKRLIALRRRHPALRQDRWLGPDRGFKDAGRPVEWWRPDGAAMTVDDWHDPARAALMIHLGEPPAPQSGGSEAKRRAAQGQVDPLLLLFNAERVPVEFELGEDSTWVELLTTRPCARSGTRLVVPALAVAVLARGPAK